MIAIEVEKKQIFFPKGYIPSDLDDDLVYFYKRNSFIPEIFVKEFDEKIFVSKRGYFLEIANLIPSIIKVNAILEGHKTVFIDSLVAKGLLSLRSIRDLAENDLKEKFYENVEVYTFKTPIKVDELDHASKIIDSFISSLSQSKRISPIELTRSGKTIEFGLRVSKFDDSFQSKQEQLVKKLEEQIGCIKSINGLNLS